MVVYTKQYEIIQINIGNFAKPFTTQKWGKAKTDGPFWKKFFQDMYVVLV